MARLVGFLNAAPYRTALVPTGRNVTGHRRCRSKASSRVLVCRASSSSASSSDENGTKGKGREESANWKEELRVLLDRDTSMDTRGILLFDLLKQSPEIAEDLYKEAKENSGLEGISPVVNQVVTDILPEIQREGPALASKALEELPNSIPKAMQELKEMSQKSGGDLPSVLLQETNNVFKKTPEGLDTPDYTLLFKRKDYEVRRYGEFAVAETPIDEDGTSGEAAAVKARADGFNTLAGYIFGGNSKSENISMTTPVIIEQTSSRTKMSFVLPSKYMLNEDNAPTPNSVDVQIRRLDGATYAVRSFPGFATEGEVKRQLTSLEIALESDEDVEVADKQTYLLLQYNPPYTLPWLRRNEVLIPVVSKKTTEPGVETV